MNINYLISMSGKVNEKFLGLHVPNLEEVKRVKRIKEE